MDKIKTRIIKLEKLSQIESVAQQTAEALNSGAMVAFPTETVYGIGVCASNLHALERLRQLKERPDNKPFTLHIGKKTDIERYLPGRNLFESTFLKKVWPGPVTIVSHLDDNQMKQAQSNLKEMDINQLYYENSIGIRFPGDLFCQAILPLVDGPVVAPSANFAGKEPPTHSRQVIDELNGYVDMIIDAGPTKLKGPSTIVELINNRLNTLRIGVVPQSVIDPMKKMTLVFVCTGNTCRSPMAMGFGRSIMAEKTGCSIDQLPDKGYNILSAGVMAFPGAPATPEAIRACQMAGVDISHHEACVLTVDLIRQADLIYTMDFPHYRTVLNLVPQAESYTYMLLDDQGVDDPIGQPLDVYRLCAAQIAEGVAKRLG